MKPASEHERHSLKAIDRLLVQNVIRTYDGCKANGHGEMAARNAAIVVLREAMPRWTFRAASAAVSQILAGHVTMARSA